MIDTISSRPKESAACPREVIARGAIGFSRAFPSRREVGWFGRVGGCSLPNILLSDILQVRFGEGKMALVSTPPTAVVDSLLVRSLCCQSLVGRPTACSASRHEQKVCHGGPCIFCRWRIGMHAPQRRQFQSRSRCQYWAHRIGYSDSTWRRR